MTHEYSIEGMHCQSCVQKITAALERVRGVSAAEVTLTPPQARVVMDTHIPTSMLDAAVKAIGNYSISETPTPVGPSASADGEHIGNESLYPLFLIVGYIVGVVMLVALATGQWMPHTLMNHFMAGFFLVFSFFKFLDLRGFADAYFSYDVVASRMPAWGFIYPFVELGLGVAYLLNLAPWTTNAVTLVVMLISAIGVLKTLLDKRTIRCACLGTVLKLPMTKVTLVEDLGMAAMAGAMLVLMAIGIH
jgi:copper chaperone CopZ